MKTLLTLLLAGCLVTACSTTPPQENRMSQSQSAPATAEEALRFGGISLPPSGKVLGSQHDKGIDERYRVVFSIPAGDVEKLLAGSKFVTPLDPDAGPFQGSVDGFELSKAKSVRSGEDNVQVGGHTVFRQVAVDESDPATSVVHLWLFTT
jgi:hypothetical protein